MKKVILGAMFLAVAGMTIISCSKYDEGPGLSMRTKKGRLAGDWVIDKYVDSDGTETPGNSDIVYTFEKDGTFKVVSGGVSSEGNWEFINKKEDLTITFTSGGFSTTDTSTILRLTNSEFWTIDDDGDQVQFKTNE